MAFFSFQLARMDPRNIRSRTTDIDLLTFAVVVNGRDQGHGCAVIPVWPGLPLESADFNEAADINGFPREASHMSPDWIIGPVEINPLDRVEIGFAAINTSDSQLPSMTAQEVDDWTIKVLDVYYSALFGEFISSLGLTPILDYIGVRGAGAVAAFFTDPVGTLLGREPQGPCNGTVFSGKKEFTGSTLTALPSTPGEERFRHRVVSTALSEIKEHYTDAEDHNTNNCGELARTDVTLLITRYEKWSLDISLGIEPGRDGLRFLFPDGGNLKHLFGLRL